MRKRNSMIAIALVILTFVITGCGNSGNSAVLRESKTGTEQNHDRDQDHGQDRKDPSWQADYSRLENRYELAVVSDNIYGCYVKDNQEGAWEFAKFYLLQGYDGQGFPIVKQQFDRIMADAMEEDYGVTEDGGTERYSKGSYYDGSDWIFVYAATQDEVDAVVRLVDSAANRAEPHWAVQNIINEEAAAYFSGQIDLDRTVEKIQNRVSLLLQESM